MSNGSENTSVADGRRRTWEERLDDANARLGSILRPARDKRVLFLVSSASEAVESFVFGLYWDLDFGIIEASRMSPELAERLDEFGFARVDASTGCIEGLDWAQTGQAGRIAVMTSGTTGLLKVVDHRPQTLNTLARVKENPERFWFVPYQLGSYAWYQMMCLSLFNPGQHIYCASPQDPVESFACALDAGATAISSTPTFWRYAFLNIEEELLRSSCLQTISLGGEIADQGILDQLSATFPSASIRHIYASSEAGAAIVVTDGKAGFPVSRLEAEGTIGVKVDDGRLFVRSPYTTAAAKGRNDEWVDTGDLVEIRDDRVYFLGREGSSMINVGGMKAFPADIEARLLQHPNVVWAQVYGRRAPLVGELPAARVVLRHLAPDPEEDEVELSRFAHQCLPEHAVPRSWDIRREIPLKPSLKS